MAQITCWCCKNSSTVYKVPLVYCAMSSPKIMGPTFFTETNSDHYIKLILALLLKELTDEEILKDKVCNLCLGCSYVHNLADLATGNSSLV